jgi:kynurenine formamidase
MRFVDLSAPIVAHGDTVPEWLRTELVFSDHAEGAQGIADMFDVPADLLRDGEGWAAEYFTRFGTHNSTHVDAPFHYNSTVEGRKAKTVDELPLDWFHSRGVCLDFSDREDGEAVEAEDLEGALNAIGHELKPLDIVLIRTDCDRFGMDPDFWRHGPGVTAAATKWLHERGVRVMGIDAWGWDRPLDLQAKEALGKGSPGIFWEAHQADLEYSQIERLANLRQLPPTGFKVSCFPLRLVGGSAAPARVVAMLED